MRTRQSTFQGSAVGAVGHFSVADQGVDGAGCLADDADRVALGIGQVDVAIGASGNPLGTAELCFLGITTVAAESLLPGAGNVVQGLFVEIDSIDGIAFPQGQHQLSISGVIESSRAIQGRAP